MLGCRSGLACCGGNNYNKDTNSFLSTPDEVGVCDYTGARCSEPALSAVWASMHLHHNKLLLPVVAPVPHTPTAGLPVRSVRPRSHLSEGQQNRQNCKLHCHLVS